MSPLFLLDLLKTHTHRPIPPFGLLPPTGAQARCHQNLPPPGLEHRESTSREPSKPVAAPSSKPLENPEEAEKHQPKKQNDSVTHMLSEKLRSIFNKHGSPEHPKPSNTLKLDHPRDKTPRHRVTRRGTARPVHGQTKQPLHKHTAQHRRANSSGPTQQLTCI